MSLSNVDDGAHGYFELLKTCECFGWFLVSANIIVLTGACVGNERFAFFAFGIRCSMGRASFRFLFPGLCCLTQLLRFIRYYNKLHFTCLLVLLRPSYFLLFFIGAPGAWARLLNGVVLFSKRFPSECEDPYLLIRFQQAVIFFCQMRIYIFWFHTCFR